MLNDLTLDAWDRMSSKEREDQAWGLSRNLPQGFRFRAIKLHRLGDHSHHVAEYEYDGAAFALIPGGEVTLGYDEGRPWEPTPEEQESWHGTAEEYEIAGTIQENIAQATLRPRTVHLPPFLMETMAGGVGWEPIPQSDPEVRKIVRDYFGKRSAHNEIECAIGRPLYPCALRRARQGRRPAIALPHASGTCRRDCEGRLPLSNDQRLGVRLWRGSAYSVSLGGSCSVRPLPDRHRPRGGCLASGVGLVRREAGVSD